MSIEYEVEAITELGESPTWSIEEQAVYWIDWVKERVNRKLWNEDEVQAWDPGERIGCLVTRSSGGLVLATRVGFRALDTTTGRLSPIHDCEVVPQTELNDGRCDRLGRFWCGSWDAAGTGALGRIHVLDLDGSCRASGSPVSMTNGIAWSPDDRTIYFSDSHEQLIYSADFDLDEGRIGGSEVFAKVTGPGLPDGATVDVDGCLWSAEYNGGRVVRYRPDGGIDRVIPLPVTSPTSCVFGGPDLDVLFVTTARYGLSADQLVGEPLAGALLAVDAGAQGLPETSCAV